MAEPKRLDPVLAAEAADRDSRAEALLVDGLDRYFAGQYDDAIHLWTRVLFLDRTHAQARAYIDRARTALAEQQRRSDEMLHASQELLDRGETGRARDLLTAAVAAAGEDERAADLRARLERIERVRAVGRAGAPAASRSGAVAPAWPRMALPSAAMWLLAAAGALVWIGARSPAVREWLGLISPQQDLVAASPEVATPVLSTAEIALVRARTLFARGRLAEALRELDRVDAASQLRGTADALRIDIERLLLTGVRDRTAATRSKETGRP